MARDEDERPRRAPPPQREGLSAPRAGEFEGRPRADRPVQPPAAPRESYGSRSANELRPTRPRRPEPERTARDGRSEVPPRRSRQAPFTVPVEPAPGENPQATRPRRLMPERERLRPTTERDGLDDERRPRPARTQWEEERPRRPHRAPLETRAARPDGRRESAEVRRRPAVVDVSPSRSAAPVFDEAPALAPELDDQSFAPADAAPSTPLEPAPEPSPQPSPKRHKRARGPEPRTETPKRRGRRRKAASSERPASRAETQIVEGPLVAPRSLGGRSLTLFVAVMTFLSALLVGGVVIVERAATAWTVGILDEVSVTVMPLDNAPIAQRLTQVADIMAETPGLSVVTVRSSSETESLLTPWLGDAIDLELLPVPRLVTAERTPDFDPAVLDIALAAIPGVTLDDHSGWNERLAGAAHSAARGAMLALTLMLLATGVAVVLATRSAVAANASTVGVLTLLGAEDRYVARMFSARFLAMGARGAAFGLVAAAVLFSALEAIALFEPARAAPQSEALFRAPRIGAVGFAALGLLGAAILALIWTTSHYTVSRQLDRLRP